MFLSVPVRNLLIFHLCYSDHLPPAVDNRHTQQRARGVPRHRVHVVIEAGVLQTMAKQ